MSNTFIQYLVYEITRVKITFYMQKESDYIFLLFISYTFNFNLLELDELSFL